MIWMMWYDNSKTDLATKIAKASNYYTEKYEKQVSTVLANPADIDPDVSVSGVKIIADVQCQRNYLLVSDQERK